MCVCVWLALHTPASAQLRQPVHQIVYVPYKPLLAGAQLEAAKTITAHARVAQQQQQQPRPQAAVVHSRRQGSGLWKYMRKRSDGL